jgi:hypothetical protein
MAKRMTTDDLRREVSRALRITDDALPLISIEEVIIMHDDLANAAEDRMNLRSEAFALILGELLENEYED